MSSFLSAAASRVAPSWLVACVTAGALAQSPAEATRLSQPPCSRVPIAGDVDRTVADQPLPHLDSLFLGDRPR